jgi:hypothetical protein
MASITIQKGNPYTATLTITNNGLPYNLTGKVVLFAMKKIWDFSADDTTAEITAICAHVDPDAGTCTLSLTASDTLKTAGAYKADVKIYLAGTVQANCPTFYVNIQDIVTKRLA